MATSDLFRAPKTGERKVENRSRSFRAPPRAAVPARKIRKRRKMQNHASRFPPNEVRIEIFRAHLFWFHIAKSKSLFKTVGVFLKGNHFFYCKMDNPTRLLLKLRFFKASSKEVYVVILQFACKSAIVPAHWIFLHQVNQHRAVLFIPFVGASCRHSSFAPVFIKYD